MELYQIITIFALLYNAVTIIWLASRYRKNERKIIERIKELDNKGYCQDKNKPCPYMDVSERGCTTCIAEKVAEEMNL